jgi:hypothetical protein
LIDVTRRIVGRPFSAWWKNQLRPANRTRLRRSYFLLSVLSFAAAFITTQSLWRTQWEFASLVAMGYVAFLGLFFQWVIPKRVILAIRYVPASIKISFLLNYLTFLMALIASVITWREQATYLLGLFILTLVGFTLLLWFIVPAWQGMVTLYGGNEEEERFNHTDRQGRDFRQS